MTELSERLADLSVRANNADTNVMSKSTRIKCALVLVSAGALALSATAPVAAAPLLSNTAAVRAAPGAPVTDVRWYYQYPGYGYRYGYSPYYSYGYAPYVYGYGYSPYYSYGYAPYSYGYSSYAYAPWY
jgi:hypothetical protein